MSSIVINLNDLPEIRAHFMNHNAKSRENPVRCRVFAQVVDIQDLDPRNEVDNTFHLCNIKLRNLPIFESVSSSPFTPSDITVRMDPHVYESVFLDQGVFIQTGSACDISLVLWHNHGQKELDSDIWEAVDLSILSLSDLKEYHDFFTTQDGKLFLSLSNPCLPFDYAAED